MAERDNISLSIRNSGLAARTGETPEGERFLVIVEPKSGTLPFALPTNGDQTFDLVIKVSPADKGGTLTIKRASQKPLQISGSEAAKTLIALGVAYAKECNADNASEQDKACKKSLDGITGLSPSESRALDWRAGLSEAESQALVARAKSMAVGFSRR
jgi:hypothetical protein